MADFDYAEDVLSGNVAPSVDTSGYGDYSLVAGGTPQKLSSPTAMPGMGTMWKESWLSNDKTRAALLARQMGINPNRIRIEDGVPYYLNENQIEVPIYDDGKMNTAKRIAMSMTGGELPKIGLGTAGAMFGGALGAGAGGALGEGIKRGVATAAFNEPRSIMDIPAVAREGAIGAAGYGLGALGTGLYNLGGRAGLGKAGSLLAKDIAQVDVPEAANLAALGSRMGVNLRAHELAGPQSTLAQEVFKLRKLPGGGDIYQKWLAEVRDPEVKNAIKGVLDTVSPERSPFRGNMLARDAARESIEGLRAQRDQAVKPLYESVFGETGAQPVDTAPVRDYLNTRLGAEGARGDIRSALEKAKTIIYGPGETELPATTRGLHEAKMALDADIESAMNSGNRAVGRELKEVRNMLRGAIEEQVPGYKSANAIYQQMSRPIEEAQKSMVGAVADLQGDRVARAGKLLLGSDTASPETIAQARTLIRGRSPEAWDAMVRGFVQDKYETVMDKLASGDIANVGGKFRNQLFGNERQRKLIETALADSPDKLRTLHQFADVLDAVGPSFVGGSQTAPMSATMQETVRGLEGSGAKAVRLARGLNWLGNAEEYLTRKGIRENAPKVMQELLTPDGAKIMQSIRRLPAGSERQAKALASFLVLSSNGALESFRKGQNYTPENYIGPAGARRSAP